MSFARTEVCQECPELESNGQHQREKIVILPLDPELCTRGREDSEYQHFPWEEVERTEGLLRIEWGLGVVVVLGKSRSRELAIILKA